MYVYFSSTGTGRNELGIIDCCICRYFRRLLLYFSQTTEKEQKRIQAMIADMEVGDTVLTTSGFYGVIIDIQDHDIIVEFGNNKNCRIPMQKAAVAQIEKASAE